ncbi:MAG TPA: tRNA-binding protein [Candidatus Marinimicrobia bacterium]|jgi:tRNA-binding protein|nr:tRNA-binding protein [Candidatus Neomarinimicrobiota bacterium]MDP6275733.1 tRNA-binding protein [Candidatus Neomarinimicrobiota bacterium]MDP7331104.1 tRNA-binding protein [Candidatus Neomarinimicrobiota bacterium]HJL73901.1 tRNA-binding protein [Candidatus Neomarinimicrobiota bacterium]HJM70559.1 tRNA-binding protein [Candidatus Neomarinimicrobiota bacterium]|tara:strand:+ start:3650 stop:3979 length:330 start_codon:yes stop_codon:yes gene_type:complete
MVNIDNFKKIELRIGTIIEVNEFPEARNPTYQLKIDFGGFGIRQSSAKVTDHYSKEDLLDRQIVAVVNFPTKKVANFNSEVLVLGTDGNDKGIILLDVDKPIQNGVKIS